jgi:hypothetical protein
MKVPSKPPGYRRCCFRRGSGFNAGSGGRVAIAAIVLCLATKCSLAGPWNFTEFFSNADGSVQFIELTCTNSNNEQDLAGGEIRTTTNEHVFVIPTALPSSDTANRSILLATENFELLPGAVLPDYSIYPGLPAHFFDPNGDGVIFYHSTHGIMDERGFFAIPTDGVHSLDLKAGGVRVNSPTNFAGQVGSVDLTHLTGDYNSNSAVDAADFVLWRNTLNSTTLLAADGSGNLIVGAEDFGVWRTNFGRALAGAGSAASVGLTVPEPSAGSFAIIAAIVVVSTVLFRRATGVVRG